MNNRPRSSILLTLALFLGLGTAYASRPVGAQITGTVTAVSGASITVNGTTYTFSSSTAAAAAAAQIQPGQAVTLILNGPANSSSTQVLGIQPASSKR